ncbi:pilus assembly protein [Brevibacillus fulvus]|uniref:Pilus assembly protein Flp/PilA n=1 Tax=Brevibacillus fulvus TaxID=1125967 RepID=A0A938Y5H1_9BACL|nr:pilus assembly protein [Brevibacillus fulvus]MBM7592296.1 pilus assembly protein Flp/PilA [Brevibacillus fulvus]
MQAIQNYAKRFVKEQDGVTIVEMVIIVAVILILIIPALVDLGETEDKKIKELTKKIS